jgi:putative endonuclease
MTYLVYLITCDNLYYIGMTNNFTRRIQQHNGILKGGAKFTKKRQDWNPIVMIDGFKNKQEAMQCEWALKRRNKNNISGILGRFIQLQYLWNRNQWTSKSPLVSDQTIHIYVEKKYKHLLTIDTQDLYW